MSHWDGHVGGNKEKEVQLMHSLRCTSLWHNYLLFADFPRGTRNIITYRMNFIQFIIVFVMFRSRS